MADEEKHVLLRDDLEPAFDEVEVLAEIEAMDEEWAGDWREHVPYAAARRYRENPETCARYQGHVDECVYCQRMVEALNPPEDVLRELDELRRRLGIGMPVAGVEEAAWRSADWAGLKNAIGDALGNVLLGVDRLATLEATEEPTAKFEAARIYLETEHAGLAYKRIGEGFTLAKVDSVFIDCVNAAANPEREAVKSLRDVAREMSQLLEGERLDGETELLRLVEGLAQLGQHRMAMDSLWTVLTRRGAGFVAEALEDAELVGVFGSGDGWKVPTAMAGVVRTKRAMEE